MGYNFTINLSSSCVKDTLGHTFTPCFSIENEVFCVFSGHSDALQILTCSLCSSSFSAFLVLGCCTHFSGYGLFRNPVIIHSQHMFKPSQPSFLKRTGYIGLQNSGLISYFIIYRWQRRVLTSENRSKRERRPFPQQSVSGWRKDEVQWMSLSQEGHRATKTLHQLLPIIERTTPLPSPPSLLSDGFKEDVWRGRVQGKPPNPG